MDKILTVNDVAKILQVKPITIREMFREKRLRAFKVGKAWRTTETMLNEDIESLTRGEKPQELPAPPPRTPAKKKATAKPQKKAAKKTPATEAEVEPKNTEDKKEPQQFLF